MRLARVANGNFGDTKIINDGVSELLHGNMLESLRIGSSQLPLIQLLMELIPCVGQMRRQYIGEQKIEDCIFIHINLGMYRKLIYLYMLLSMSINQRVDVFIVTTIFNTESFSAILQLAGSQTKAVLRFRQSESERQGLYFKEIQKCITSL